MAAAVVAPIKAAADTWLLPASQWGAPPTRAVAPMAPYRISPTAWQPHRANATRRKIATPLASACERSSAKARTAHPTSRVASSVAATSSISAASSMQKPNPKRARTRAMKHAMQEKRRQTLA
ncbi:Uncharacterised protein [Bordetella pertussis]|nr:Uncharacterised protein [Bordetella pertussis]CPM31732.1 Uncharacterised protein [Bordetella pertussis]CPO64541.1 Uncharacterised protein [Bordetella pertussis]CPP93809.1 Uncharacterised protein [Bordetella pertussis]